MIIGIDPGPVSSAYAVVCPDYSIKAAAKVDNQTMRDILHGWREFHADASTEFDTAVIESIQSFGKPVGRETFETCYQIGRLQEICDNRGTQSVLIPRQEYANAICGCQASDSKLRQALLLRFGSDAKGQPLNALKGHSDLRSAYAVAVYYLDRQKWTNK